MRKTKQISSGISNSGNHISMSKKNKNLFFALFVSLLLVAAIIIVVSGVNSRKYSGDNDIVKSTPPHSIIKTACSTALYPELCFSATASEPDLTQKVSTNKDVIVLSLNVTIRAVQHNYFTVKKMQSSKNLTKRGKTALHDCLETIDLSLDGLHRVVGELEEYPKNKSMSEYSDDLKTLLSATITYQETCLDGFSHGEEDRHVREGLRDGHVHVEHMSSNALAMVKNMTDTDIGNYERKIGSSNRKMMEAQGGGINWPKWMSAADRRLLQSTTVIPNVVVAADGTGNFRTVSAAVAAAPEQSSNRYIIKINAGTYSENVAVPKTKTNIMFVGDGASNTIITGSRNVADGSTTFDSATVAVVGERFLARGITFQNTAGPSKNQAVALRVGADLSAFYNCDILAYQDTLYVHSNRQFFVQCLIAGTVDFIFGNSAVVFQNCNIRPRRPNPGQENTITAQGRTDPNQNTGIVIQQCQIVANTDLAPVEASVHTYLGRPWKEYSRTVVMETYLGDLIDPAGWLMWSGNFALNTLYYGEYENTGPGADTAGRVNWQGFRVITSASEAQGFTPGSFIAGASWLGSTGFPYSLGL